MIILNEKSALNKVWCKRNTADYAEKISKNYGINLIIANILANRDVPLEDIESYINPKLKILMKEPFLIKDMDKSCKLIIESLNNKENIVILGDYDVDGITSTAILYKYLNSLEANVFTYLPNRYSEGYGISFKALENILKLNPKLLILLDNGSVSYKEIQYIKDRNINVIVVDHHGTDTEALPSDAFVNPNRNDDSSNKNYLCTVGLTFLLLVALNRSLKENNFFQESKIIEIDIMQFLDLVALGTICDMVPLKKLNRAFVNTGLKIFKSRNNYSLSSLLDVLGLNKPVDAETLGFTVGPCINAGSRMGDSNLPLRMLLSSSPIESFALAEKLKELNIRRQKEEEKIINASIREIENSDNIHNIHNHFIFIGSTKYLAGVVGIIAGRVKEIYNKPTCIFAIDTITNTATASGRSVSGINLGDIIIGAKQRGLLIKGGGHAQAVGFTFSLDKKEELFNFINNEVYKRIKDKPNNLATIEIDGVLPINFVNLALVEQIQSLSPFGMFFPEPTFLLSSVKITDVKKIGIHQNHLSLCLSDGHRNYLRGFCFKCFPGTLGNSILSKSNTFVDAIVQLKLNFYQGSYRVNFNLLDVS